MDDDEEEYRGPRRRRGEAEHRNGGHGGNVLRLKAPGWLGGGSLEITGQYVLALFAIVVLALGSGTTAWLAWKSSQAHAAALDRGSQRLQEVQHANLEEHKRIVARVEALTDVTEQALCLQTLSPLREDERKAALRSGDVCIYIGVRPRARVSPWPEERAR